jgi:hypothetical protein
MLNIRNQLDSMYRKTLTYKKQNTELTEGSFSINKSSLGILVFSLYIYIYIYIYIFFYFVNFAHHICPIPAQILLVKYAIIYFFSYIFFYNRGVRASLRAPRLIPGSTEHPVSPSRQVRHRKDNMHAYKESNLVAEKNNKSLP